MEFPDSAVQENGSLNLSGGLLSSLSQIQNFAIVSPNKLHLYGSGTFGSASSGNLTFDTPGILGDNWGEVTFKARGMTLLDSTSAVPDGVQATGGSLTISLGSGAFRLGTGSEEFGGYSAVSVTAPGGVYGLGSASFSVDGDLSLTAPLLTADNGTSLTISSLGKADLISVASTPTVNPGKGATISLKAGKDISLGIPVSVPGGQFSAEALSGNLSLSGKIDAGGFQTKFPGGAVQYSPSGSISLMAYQGGLMFNDGAFLALLSPDPNGTVGSLTLKAGSTVALRGSLTAIPVVLGGSGGSFTGDFGSLPPGVGTLGLLEQNLAAGGFTSSQNLRIRSGDLLIGQGETAKANHFTLSADQGTITVAGAIDASGSTGGSISLFAGKDVIIADGAKLTAYGNALNSAGTGGTIDLEAGNMPELSWRFGYQFFWGMVVIIVISLFIWLKRKRWI